MVLDLRMPDLSGLDVLRALRAEDPATRILILTGYGSIATAVDSSPRSRAGRAARRLGLHRRSLQRKLQKYPPSR